DLGPDPGAAPHPRPGRRCHLAYAGAGDPRADVSAMTSVESLLEGKRIVICAGSGGVGKTTTAAALGLGMAERGLRVAVVTIDPAKRLPPPARRPESRDKY